MTEAPRSLKEPVGMNHSHFSSAVAPPTERGTSGVRPSPMLIGAPWSGGRAARYRHRLRSPPSISSRPMPGMGVSINGAPSSPHQRGRSSGQVLPVRGSR
jgi:hypothetical protein